MHAILRQIVGMVLNSAPECAPLQRYIVLKREIATVAASSLEKMKVRGVLFFRYLSKSLISSVIKTSVMDGVPVRVFRVHLFHWRRLLLRHVQHDPAPTCCCFHLFEC